MDENTHVIEQISAGFRKVAKELEEFQVQLALGKMAAKDKYEEVKKDFNSYVNDFKQKYEGSKELWNEYKAQLEDLQVQLALGKAETVEAFREQKHKIITKVREIENQIKSHPLYVNWYPELLAALEKVKIELEILDDYYDEAKTKVSVEFDKRKKQLEETIEDIRDKFRKNTENDSRWDVFQEEIALAYSHLKKAIFQK